MPAPHLQRGFTLIELLVVIAIIGIITTLLTFNASHWLSHATVQSEAERLRHKLHSLADQAVITQIAIGLVMTPNRIQLFQHKQGKWQAQLPPIEPAAGIRFRVPPVIATTTETSDTDQPDIALYLGPDGRATPVRLGLEDAQGRCDLNINAAVGITSDCTDSR